MSDKKLSALIAGGGLGGLATAAALAQRGWDVTVLERQSELRANGSGIYIWENGLRVLKALGAYEQAIEGAFYGSHFEQRDLNNEVIDCGPTPPDRRLITVMRSQLLKSLEQAGKRAGVKVRTNVEVIAASARGEVQLASGERLRADLVVGADGIWSRIRQSLGLELVHEQTREGALRTMITRKPDDTPEQDAQKYIENWNGLHRLLITPVSETQTYLALTCPYDDVRASNVQIDKEYWSALFPHWAHLIERADGPVSWGRYSVTRCKSLVQWPYRDFGRRRPRSTAEPGAGWGHGHAKWPGFGHVPGKGAGCPRYPRSPGSLGKQRARDCRALPEVVLSIW